MASLRRLAVWGGGIVLGAALLFVAGMLAFGPAVDDDERDHRPPSVANQLGDAKR